MAVPLCPVCLEYFDPTVTGRCSECGTNFTIRVVVSTGDVPADLPGAADHGVVGRRARYVADPHLERAYQQDPQPCCEKKLSPVSLCGVCGQ